MKIYNFTHIPNDYEEIISQNITKTPCLDLDGMALVWGNRLGQTAFLTVSQSYKIQKTRKALCNAGLRLELIAGIKPGNFVLNKDAVFFIRMCFDPEKLCNIKPRRCVKIKLR